MPAFRSLQDLEQSVRSAGLGPHLQAIVKTVRPVVLFVRAQEPDDPIPVGTSKLGGNPNLPPGMAWPTRPAYPDAEKRRLRLQKQAKSSQEFSEKLASDRTFDERQRASFRQLIESNAAWTKARAEFGFQPFPMAFVAQLNLAALSREPGFSIELPDTGMLSVFTDVIGGGETRVLWFDQPVDQLVTMQPPRQLVDWYDRFTPLGLYTREDERWQHQTMAEVLHAFSGLAVPDHWQYAYPRDTPLWHAFYDWLHDGVAKFEYSPNALVGTVTGMSANFGDRLGGWPANIQGPPEPDFASQVQIGNRTIVPGRTIWWHLFGYGGENWGGTRIMPPAHNGDGTTYILIREADLAARRFHRAGHDYQMD